MSGDTVRAVRAHQPAGPAGGRDIADPVDAPLSLALQVGSVANVARYVGLPKRSQSLAAPTAVQRFDAWCVFLRCCDQITPSIGTVRVL